MQLGRNGRLVDGDKHFVAATIVLGIFLFEFQAESVNGELGLFQRDAGLEARNHGNHAKAALVHERLGLIIEHEIAHRDRNPQVGTSQRTDIAKFAGRYSDDGKLLLIQLNGAAKNVAVGGKLGIPKRKAENGHGTRGGVLFRCKAAAKKRLHTQNVKEISVHQLTEDLLLLARNDKLETGGDSNR